jgi:hypothetical protein
MLGMDLNHGLMMLVLRVVVAVIGIVLAVAGLIRLMRRGR